ncbi:hypothetical protein RYX36_018302 [Vicia faba]
MQGNLSAWLVKHGIVHGSLGFDYQGIETLQIKPEDWHSIAVILYVYGYNYLRSQCAYDVAPGGLLESVYHLTRIEYSLDQPEEVDFLLRAIEETIASPIAASAATIAITKIEKIFPFNWRLSKKSEKVTRFIFTAFNISSRHIRALTIFRLVINP